MRKIQMFSQLIPVLFSMTVSYAQTDPQAAIREALTAKYGLTTTTADRTGVVNTGSVLILKKSNLLTANAIATLSLSNTYKGGDITQGLMGHMANGAEGTRTFVAGEKLWVTGIEVKSKSIVFTLFSDSYSGIHYRTTLTFPFAKGATPSTTDATTMVSQVFDTEGPRTETGVEHMPAAEQQVLSSNRGNTGVPIPSAVPIDNTPWDSRHGRLTSDELARMNQPNLGFQLNYFRLNPRALDEKATMQYFIALNNCNDKDVERALKNELDYPALAAFYSANAPRILHLCPKPSMIWRWIDISEQNRHRMVGLCGRST